MATKVYTEEVVSLQDDTEVTLRPSPIGRLRRIMAEWKKFENLKDDDDTFQIFVNCCGIALEKELAGKFDRTEADPKITEEKNEVLAKPYKDYLEETLDMDTIYKIMEVCAGMKLNDPNLQAAAARIMEDGTN